MHEPYQVEKSKLFSTETGYSFMLRNTFKKQSVKKTRKEFEEDITF